MSRIPDSSGAGPHDMVYLQNQSGISWPKAANPAGEIETDAAWLLETKRR
jgi:hypothetical protein